MRKSIVPFLLGIFITVSVAATTNNLMTVKPATPISTVSYTGENPTQFTTKYASMGYQVVSSASCGYYNTYVAMVRY